MKMTRLRIGLVTVLLITFAIFVVDMMINRHKCTYDITVLADVS